MKSLIIIIAVVAWLACGVVAAGYLCAFLQRKDKTVRKETVLLGMFAAKLAIAFGPFGLISAVADREIIRYGWLWPWSAKARKEAGIES